VRYDRGPDGQIVADVFGYPVTVIQVCTEIFRHVSRMSEDRSGRPVGKVVLAAPVGFEDYQRNAIARAAKLAGLETVAIIDEPVAAAIAFGASGEREQLIAVYDFGGGTFDFSVVHVGPDKMKVVTTAGDGWLGGDDFDEALAGAAANAFWQQTQIELRNQVHHWRRLLFRAEGAKRNLTDEEETTVRLPGAANTAEGELDLVYPITRDKFAELTGGIVKRSLETCRAALKARKLEPTDLNAVFLSGGTTYIPAVRDAVAEFFGQTPRVVVPPERAVLVGAAVHGALFHKELAQRLVQ
jgi:molecular chaperone DnaK